MLRAGSVPRQTKRELTQLAQSYDRIEAAVVKVLMTRHKESAEQARARFLRMSARERNLAIAAAGINPRTGWKLS